MQFLSSSYLVILLSFQCKTTNKYLRKSSYHKTTIKLIMFKEAKIHESMHECDNCKTEGKLLFCSYQLHRDPDFLPHRLYHPYQSRI